MSYILAWAPLAQSGARDDTVNRAMSLLASLGDAPMSTELAMALIDRSIATMPLEPEGLEHWMAKARSSYERALALVDRKPLVL